MSSALTGDQSVAESPHDDELDREAHIDVEREGKQRSRPGALSIASWTIFAVAASRALWLSLTQDFRRQALVSDQASFLYSAMSIAYDFDLSYLPVDAERWRSIGWTTAPTGLFFQVFNDGAANAKPYGYPLFLAPFIRFFGPVPGVAIANSVLVTIAVVAVLLLLRKRFSWPVAAIVTSALLLVSNVSLYALPIGVEPLYLALVSVFFLAVWNGIDGLDRRVWWSVLAVVCAAFLIAEKQPMLVLVAPTLILLVARQQVWRHRLVVLGVGLAVFAVAIFPYVHYSNGRSITPYGGLRYASYGGLTWVGPGSDAARSQSDSVSSVSYALDHAFSNFDYKAKSASYYLLGQHTGLLVWLPLAVFVVILTLVDLRKSTPYGIAALMGMLGFVAFYLALFPSNTYGGAQVLGNRYFVQACPVVAAVVAGTAIRARRLVIASCLSIFMVVTLLWPQFAKSPRDALVRMDRTSWLQSQFMWESEVQGVRAFEYVEIPPKQLPMRERGIRP